MTTLNALTAGIRSTNKSFRLIALLYVVNFLIAAIVAWGFQSVLASSLGDSLSLERLVRDFDYTVFSDFMFKDGARINALLSQVTWLVAFYVLVNTLLGGGTIAALASADEQFSMRAFFEACGNYFFRFFRLLLIFAAIAALIVLPFTAIVGIIYSAVTASAVSEVWPFTLAIILFLLSLFVLMLIIMMADYAKIATVKDDARSMLKIAWTSVKFVFRHFLSTTMFQLSVVLLIILAVLLYLFIENRVGMATPITILLMFLVQQVSVGFKIYARVLTFGGELELFRKFGTQKAISKPAPVPEPVATPIPVPVPPTVQEPAQKPAKKKTSARRPVARKPRTQARRTTKKAR